MLSALSYEPVNIMATTQMSANAAADQDTIAVLNTESFEVGKSILIGEGETAEIARIESLTDEGIVTVDDLKFNHLQGDAIKQLLGNSIRFFRAANVDGTAPANGSFSVLATVPIVADEAMTEYLDPIGGSDYWYKFIYFDTDNVSDYSSLEDSEAVRGGNYGNYATVEDVRNEAGLQNNTYISDQFLLGNLEFAQAMVKSAVSKAGYSLPLDPVPTVIKQLTIRLAAGYTLRSKVVSSDDAILEQGNGMVTDAEDWLEKLASGELKLLDATGTVLPTSSSVVSTAFSDTSVEPWFTRDKTY